MNVDLEALAGPRDRLMVGGAVDPVTELEKLLDDAELAEDLKRPGVNPDRPRLLRPRGLLVQHPDLDSASCQLDRQHHPGGPCPDDDHLLVRHHHSLKSRHRRILALGADHPLMRG